MASMSTSSVSLAVVVVVLAAMVGGGWCFTNVPPGPNITTTYDGKWRDAMATWYGSNPAGAAPDDHGGACGYKDVDKPPFDGMTACGNEPIFKDGLGCGSCYEIKCVKPVECSGQPIIVKITDMNYEHIAPYHFDLSGKAFGSMAKKGLEQKLRSAGELQLQFRRVKCKYPPGTKITFHVEKGSNPNYMALLVKYAVGNGNIVGVDIKSKNAKEFQPMKHSWGAIWRLDTPVPIIGPVSVRLTTEGGVKIVQENAIPAGWKANTVYPSNIQFPG